MREPVTKSGTTSGSAPPAPASAALFTPVSSGRVSEIIVDQVRTLVRQGRLQPGDRLPSERDLCERFGVSRVTVREALRMLEGIGLVDIRLGARGGAFVKSPTSRQVGAGISDLLTLSDIDPVDVTEARRVLELGVVSLVCAQATEEDIAALQEICDRSRAALESDGYPMELSAEFHVRFAEASHNRAISMLVHSLREPMLVSLERSHQQNRMGQEGLREHYQLVKAIRARDATAATRIMERHLARTASRLTPARTPRQAGRPRS